MVTPAPEVLIVGAGPTGLTVACGLARCGVEVRLVDQSLEPSRSARATGYMARTLEIFDDLGVYDEVMRGTWADLSMRGYRDGVLTRRHGIPDPADGFAKHGTPYMLRYPTDEVPYPMMARPLPTWRVEEVLRGRLADFGVSVEYGRRLVDLRQDGTGVTATIAAVAEDEIGWGHSYTPEKLARERPTTGEVEVVEARYVVGCDGGGSATRELAGIAFEPGASHDWVGYIAEVQIDGLEPTFSFTYTRSDGGFLHVNPIPHAKNFQLQTQAFPDGDGDYPEITLDLVQSWLDDHIGEAEVRAHDLTWASLWRVREALANQYRVGRVFVAGDAAHIHSPMGGQGANTGIGDGYNLGWKLGHVVQGWAADWILDTYEDERRPFAAHVVRSSGERHKANLARGRTPFASGEAPSDFTYWTMSQLGLSYPDSELSGGTPLPAEPTSGDRAPDGRLIDATDGARLRLFDIYRGPHFTLLLFGADFAPLAAAAAARYSERLRAHVVKGIDDTVEGWSGSRLVDPDGLVAQSYQAEERPLVLVRPDGYITFHGPRDGGDALLAHIARIVGP